MTYFETPNDRRAYVLGISTETLERWDDLVTADEEELYAAGEPNLDPEARERIAYSDVIDPDAAHVWGYGGDHRVLVPGAYGLDGQ